MHFSYVSLEYAYLVHVLFNVSLASGPRQTDRQTDRGAGLGQANCHHLSNMGKNEYNDCTKERQPCHMLLCADWLQV